ncbi:hypothetical protein [Neobacillus sp. FSL H8-0543]|uniref:hypothetical protein n=1 Tax=Neobacillus sp. FSL H8-0543 TaxID=2954672 RepID=UPI003158ACF1
MQEEQVDYAELLAEYRRIWNNRQLETAGRDNEAVLKETIKRELLDEYSHPRIRKNRYEKFYAAVNRVVQSVITSEAKIRLIHVHTQVMDELNKE